MSAIDRLRGLVSNVAIKAPCLVATTAPITLSGLQTIDDIAVVADDRVLVWQQTDPTQNGIYTADTGNWTRDADFNGAGDCVLGTLVLVTDGTLYASTLFRQTTVSPVIGTSAITFARGTTGEAVVDISASGTIAAGNLYNVDTTAGPITLTIPVDFALNGEVGFQDRYGTWATHNLTLDTLSVPIIGDIEFDDDTTPWTLETPFRVWLLRTSDGLKIKEMTPLFSIPSES